MGCELVILRRRVWIEPRGLLGLDTAKVFIGPRVPTKESSNQVVNRKTESL